MLGALCMLAGCASWQPSVGDPRQTAIKHNGRPIRVVTGLTRTLTFDSVQVVGDSLIGFRAQERATLPLSTVKRLEYRRPETVRVVLGLAGLIVFAPLVVVGLIAILVNSTA